MGLPGPREKMLCQHLSGWKGFIFYPQIKRVIIELPVRSDENPKHSINEVNNWLLGFSHPVDDEGDEEDVGECGVDASVEGNSPLLAKPGRVVNTCTVCWPGEKKNAKMQY